MSIAGDLGRLEATWASRAFEGVARDAGQAGRGIDEGAAKLVGSLDRDLTDLGRLVPRNFFKGVADLQDPLTAVIGKEGVLLQSPEGRALAPDATAALHAIRPGAPLPRDISFVGTVSDPLGPLPKEARYLYTIDETGLKVARESTPFPSPRKNICHTNLSSRAFSAGEAWFLDAKTVVINPLSGRFGARTEPVWNRTIAYWKAMGYDVKAAPLPSKMKAYRYTAGPLKPLVGLFKRFKYAVRNFRNRLVHVQT